MRGQVSANESTVSRLERLCSNAKLRLQSNTSLMAKVVDHHEFSKGLMDFFEYFTDDPSAIQKSVHSVFHAMRDFRGGFNESTGLTTSSKQYILKHILPELLLGILIGENENSLLDKNVGEITGPLGTKDADSFSKYRHDLKHNLYLHEDFALSIVKKKHGVKLSHHGKFDMATKLIANAKYLSDNSIFNEGYYLSPSFAVSVANAHLTRVLESLRSTELWFEYEYLDEFIAKMGDVVSSARKVGYLFGGLRSKCESMHYTAASEIGKHKATSKNTRMYRLYRGQLNDIRDFLRDIPKSAAEKKLS